MIDNYKKIKKMINDLRSFLYKNPQFKFGEVRYNGSIRKTIKTEEFTDVFPNVILIFFDEMNKKGFATVSSGKTYVGINIFDDVTPSTVYYSLLDHNVTDIIIHEFTHILDMKSHKDLEKALGNYNKSDYDNHYWERNAFFYNISRDLLDRIAFIETHGITNFNMIYKDVGDMNEYIKDIIKNLSGEQKSHWEMINPTNKKRFLVRFYQLFNYYKSINTL